MNDMVIPDSIEPVVAWRAWRVTSGRLRSVTAGADWPVREPLHAHCASFCYYYTPGGANKEWLRRHPGEGSPFEPCWCGIYGARDESHARGIARAHHASCVGLVAMWGKVIEGPRGWRAEYAYPLELILTDGRQVQGGFTAPSMWSDQAVDLLGKAYGVPVTIEGRGV